MKSLNSVFWLGEANNCQLSFVVGIVLILCSFDPRIDLFIDTSMVINCWSALDSALNYLPLQSDPAPLFLRIFVSMERLKVNLR